MPNRCTWIDEVEFEPISDGNLHFTLISGDERMRFCMPRTAARTAAEKVGRLLDVADIKSRFGEVIRLEAHG